MHLRDASFVVVDTETTGVRAADDRLIELAAVRVQGGAVVDRFSQLINPGRSVPRRITEITGISTAMLFKQPAIGEVMPRFLDFLGTGVFVAHNLPFDLGFLNAELGRLGRPPLTNDTLCTLRLARRLLPGLASKGLASVADFLGIEITGRHRALGDAEATAAVLLRFLRQLGDEHDVDTLHALLGFQHRNYRQVSRPAKHLRRIREEVLPRLPERPGVYFMKDARGALLYIGKAVDLRARVRSYFTAVEAHPTRTRQLVDAVREVAWEETGSELGALLLESRLIKEHQPRFNRAQRRYRTRPFIRLDVTHRFPRVSSIPFLLDDGAEYFGPLAGRRQAELVVELINRFYRLRECDDDTFAYGRRCMYAGIGRCPAPCEAAAAEAAAVAEGYAAEVQRVRDFLSGRDRSVLERLAAAMRTASARMEFEQAATYRDWYRKLERMLDRQQRVAASVLEHNAVLLLPGVEAGTVQGLLVRYGRHVGTVGLPAVPAPADAERLRAALAAHFRPDLPRPERYLKQEVDEIRILAHWMYVHRDSTTRVAWNPSEPIDDLLHRVLAVVRAGVAEGGGAEDDPDEDPEEA